MCSWSIVLAIFHVLGIYGKFFGRMTKIVAHVSGRLVGLFGKGMASFRILIYPVVALLLSTKKCHQGIIEAGLITDSPGSERKPVDDFADREILVRTILSLQRK